MDLKSKSNMQNLKKNSMIAYRTCFSSLSYYGHKLDILKSGLQKYMRRREEDKMLWCLAEIYLFKVYARTDQEKKLWKDINTTKAWKEKNLKEIVERMKGWQLETFKESYKHKLQNGISLFKKKLLETK